MNRKNLLAVALYNLQILLDDDIKKESTYQNFFEQHPIVFEVLGYSSHISMASGVKLKTDSETHLTPKPDFVVKNDRGLYEIFELKTPVEESLVVDADGYRSRFTALVSSYISQTITYDRYFTRNPENRKYLKENYGIDLQEDLDIKIIIGRNANIDKALVHSKCRELTWKVDIITYDDILDKLQKEYQANYGIHENLKGFSFHFIIRIHTHSSRGYILDIGSIDKDRFSFYIDERNNFNLSVLDSIGRNHALIIENSESQFIDEWAYISCELGNSNDEFVMNVSLNGQEKQKIVKDKPVKIDYEIANIFVGSSIEKSSFGIFDLPETITYGHTLTYKEKFDVINIIVNKYGESLHSDGYVKFDGTVFLFASGQSRKLIQPDLKYAPIFVQNDSKLN